MLKKFRSNSLHPTNLKWYKFPTSSLFHLLITNLLDLLARIEMLYTESSVSYILIRVCILYYVTLYGV